MKTKKNENIAEIKTGFFKAFFRILIMGAKTAPLQFTAFLFIDTCNGVISASFAYFMQRFFDTAANNKGYSLSVLTSLLTLCGVLVLQHIINGTGHTLIPNLRNKMNRNAISALNKKLSLLSPVMFEDKRFLDNVEKAYKGTDYSLTVLVPVLRFFFLYLPYAIVMGIYLYSLDTVLAISMILVFIPTIASYLLQPGILFQLEDESAPLRRENAHYKDCIVHPTYYKETRTLGIYQFFLEKYKISLDSLNKKVLKAQLKVKTLEFISSLLTVGGYGGVLYLLVNSLLKGNITTGTFAAVFSSIGYTFMMADEGLEELLAPTNRIATVKNFIDALDIPVQQKKNIDVDFKNGITLENISFRYTGSMQNAVNNVSLKINVGETIAIVGTNGSGKTTLARLLLGIYSPDKGTVKIGKQDIKEIAPECIYKGESAVFQKYQRYKLTLSENIMISETSNPVDTKLLEECATKSDINVHEDTFPDGMNTMLSRDYDGVDLSGGQWQRIAIARGLYRMKDVIVLDEPTAAIDPIEETKIYEKFAKISHGKTAVLITHRIGSARIADRIVVLNAGEVVEIGSHEELMSRNGAYKEMLEAQKKWYN